MVIKASSSFFERGAFPKLVFTFKNFPDRDLEEEKSYLVSRPLAKKLKTRGATRGKI